MPTPNDSLELLLEYLKEEGPYVLASPEDANYFRNAKPKKKKEVLQKSPLAADQKSAEDAGNLHQVVESERKMGQALEQASAASKQSAIEEPLPPLKPKPSHPVQPLPEIKPQTPPSKKPIAAKEEPHLEKPSSDLSSVRKILSIVAPELAILNEIPSDTTAQKISERWKTKNQSAPLSILVYQEPPEQRALLEQITRALDIYFGPAKIVQAEGIEKDKQWGAFLSVAELKTIIICDYSLWQLGNLMQFYKETPAQGIRLLGNVPVFLLPDLSLYLKDPPLKRSLWKALCQKFS